MAWLIFSTSLVDDRKVVKIKLHFKSKNMLLEVAFPFSITLMAFLAGDFRGVDTPVPVPNTEVKDSIAEGSAGLARARVGRRRPFFIFHR